LVQSGILKLSLNIFDRIAVAAEFPLRRWSSTSLDTRMPGTSALP
jgi:hypothetical protein